MRIDPHYCRFMVVDAVMLPHLYAEGVWEPRLLPAYICTHPRRQSKDGEAARAQGLPGAMCTASISGQCRLYEDAPVSSEK